MLVKSDQNRIRGIWFNGSSDGATEERLVAIYEIGDKMASSLVEYFSNEDARAVIKRLAEAGVNMTYKGKK